jgi:cytochrome c peroxidase
LLKEELLKGKEKKPIVLASNNETPNPPLDLLNLANNPPLGLPVLPEELLNSLTREKISLGRKLFFDRRLSLNSTMSCAMCHVPNQGFTSNEIATAVGFEGRSVRRNSPSLYNIAYAKTLFHDAREDSLSQQVWAPFLARNEMANPSVGYVINKLKALPDYNGLFEKAFDAQKKAINIQTIGDALAAYQQTLISANSPFDRWHYGKQSPAQAGISSEAVKGFELFKGKAGCITCHQVGKNSALFTNQGIHNTGLGYENSMGKKPKKQKVMLAPGVFVDVDQSIIDNVGEKPAADLGHYEISQDPKDRWKYKTPMLRNVALSAPYMHDGSFSTLQSVVEFYNQGGIENPGLDSLLRPLGLNDTEVSQIVAFLESLTGNNVGEINKDASAAPIGDTSKQDLQPRPPVKGKTKKVTPLANALGGDFQLTDHNGNDFDLKQLRGKVSLMFFGYTHCPDVCPTELANMARLLKQLDAESDKIQGLFVSVDPKRDTPERLSQYVPYFHPKLIGLTGSLEEVETVTSAYKVHSSIQKTGGKDLQYLVDHAANLFIIDGNGKLAQIVPFGFPQAHILEAVKRSIAKLDSPS